MEFHMYLLSSGCRFLAVILFSLFLATNITAGEKSDESIMFEAETLEILELESEQCVQVGLFLTYRGSSEKKWSVLNATLSYNAPHGLLNGSPVVRLSKFEELEPGLSANSVDGTSWDSSDPVCDKRKLLNSVILGNRYSTQFLSGYGGGQITESVNSMTGRIELAAQAPGPLFSTSPGRKLLFAVVSFPIVAEVSGTIDLQFVPDDLVLDSNALGDFSGQNYSAYTLDGAISIRPRWSKAGFLYLGWTLFASGFTLPIIIIHRRKRSQYRG